MIEKHISKDAWDYAINAVETRPDDLKELLGGLANTAVSNDYVEGCIVGTLTYADALIHATRRDPDYIAWVAQRVSTNLIYILHRRGVNPYGPAAPGTPVPRHTQEEIDARVKRILAQFQTPSPDEGGKEEGS